MITPVSINTVWISPDIDDDRCTIGYKKTLNCENDIKKAQTCLENTFNGDCVDKTTAPINHCVDKTASCSKKSFCNFTSTNSSVDKMASVSKKVSHASVLTSAASLNCTGMLAVESFKFAMRCETKQNPDGTTTLVRVHNRPYFPDSDSDSD
ncbi:hypothetical protein [Estrella lausannensis]|uniref:Uncharacterized protein n=1 Tax=Estrella lausannensis TaxID=483423 RepID=A0A0H5E646_9BACT|nr:hypothetical protein [Estrella lausannensis]CRX38730.1 hypothetical protein ELAC_1394 [Estrella lausannensis]